MPQPEKYFRRLLGKVAIVTGAGTQGDGFGTGKAMAYLFAREGAKVCLVDMDKARVEQAEKLIASAGGEVLAVVGDVTKSAGAARIVDETLQHWGRLGKHRISTHLDKRFRCHVV